VVGHWSRVRAYRACSLLVGMVSVLAGVGAAPAGADRSVPVTVEQGKWQQLADKYYALGSTGYDQQVAAGQNVAAFHVAALAWYAGQEFGWHDARTKVWLRRVYDRQDPDGGYGLGYPYAAFDKVLNTADTSYTITTAWHVGRMLLDGYDHGAVPRVKLIQAATSLLNTAESPRAECIAYSSSPNDANEPCVFNVTAAASVFLNECLKRGVWVPGRFVETTRKIAHWRDYLLSMYQPELNGWTYGGINNPALLDDPGHLAPTATGAYLLPHAQGYHAVTEYFFHYPTAIATVDMLPFYCAGVDTDYPVQANYAATFSDATDPATKVALGANAPVELRVQTLCGKHPSGLWSWYAKHHPAPTPVIITPYTSLAAAANNTGTSDATTYGKGNFDGYGDSYDRAQLPAAGAKVTYDGVTFQWPTAAAGQPDNVAAHNQNIALRGTGRELAFLGARAGSASGPVTVTYSDGTTSQAALDFGPWANTARPANAVLDTIGNYGRTGFNSNGVHYDVSYASIPLDPSKTVTMITLPRTAYQTHFFAAAIKA
jgi:hypothetical protein